MTREEAINEIKSWDFLEGKEIDAIHTLVPELAESEDEKTRKSLLAYIKGESKRLDRQKWIAYLEKQKENNEYVFRPLAGTDIIIAAEQAIRRAKEGDHLVLAFNGMYLPVREYNSAKELVDEYDTHLEKQKDSISIAKYIEDVAHAFEDGRKKGIEERQKEQKPIKMEVYEAGKGTTICGQDYKSKKD